MNKEVVVHIQNGILLSHKKEYIWVSSNEVGEPRAYYTEWSQSEREKHILYINAYRWNLEKWYSWAYLQGRNTDTDIEDRLVDTVGEGGDGTNWESSTKTYTLPYVKQTASGNLLYNRESFNLVRHSNLEGWNRAVGGREVPEEGDICILIAESCCCMPETNTTL